eukprot:14520273-Ditylum_brightwellii.AAC.1
MHVSCCLRMPHSKPSRNSEQQFSARARLQQQKTQLALTLQKLLTCTAPLITFLYTNQVMYDVSAQ